jgi:aminoglycoside N3'-acetyltransferase
MTPAELRRLFEDLLLPDERPVMVYSAIWPLARLLELKGPALGSAILDALREAVGDQRLLLMPTFTHGYKDGMLDLNTAPSLNGVLTEAFRQAPGVRRTVSAFFSFAVAGPGDTALVDLRPQNAWGEGSIFAWCEEQDCSFLMLGVLPTVCSYLHRMEWLMRYRIPYRYDKAFAGTVRHEGVLLPLTETLFVRSLAPPAINDFTVLTPSLLQAGMRRTVVNGVSFAAMETNAMRDCTLRLMSQDPLCVLRNRTDFEKGSLPHNVN